MDKLIDVGPGRVERRHPAVGVAVVFVDERGEERWALVTAVWGPASSPAVNLCFVSSDEVVTNPAGRALTWRTSIVHRSLQAAPGNYWRWPEEVTL